MTHRIRYAMSSLAVAALAGYLTVACSTLPPAPPATSASARTPTLVGARGELSATRSKAILAAVDRSSEGTDLLQRHLANEEAITDLPLTIGNRVTLLQDGPATYRAMYAAIRAAR